MSTDTTSSPDLLKAALWYAAHGWFVFPCRARTKTPQTKHGVKDATTDVKTIRGWWQKWPDANIGIATSQASGIFAVDNAPRHGGPASLQALEQEYGPLPDTVRSRTGTGENLVFKHPGQHISNDVGRKLGAGLDIRGDGGYILAAPSLHPNGQRYTWHDGHSPKDMTPAAAPAWLVSRIMTTAHERHASQNGHRAIPEGQRNDTLFRDGCAMRGRGFGYDAILAALLLENEHCCHPPLTTGEVETIAASAAAYDPTSDTFGTAWGKDPQDFEDWPEPLALPDALLAVESFEPKLLPAALRPWIEDIAERMQCPLDYPAVAVMIAAAAVVGRRVGIPPKRRDDWLVVPNLWGGIIGPPGVLKTPAIQEPLKPLRRLEWDAQSTYETELLQFDTGRRVFEEEEKVVSGDIRAALKQGRREEAERLAGQLQAQHSQEPPVRRRFVVNDVTVEKLGELLNQNPDGLLMFRDELTGFLRSLDREGHETDRAFYLEAWNGNGRFVYDRIARGTIEIQAACVSILGSIQPGPLGHYLHATLHGGVGDDGLMQRFQLLVWPDIPREWKNVDRWPETHAKRQAFEMFERLRDLTAASLDATCDEEDGGIPYLRFDAPAQELFDEWRAELEMSVRREDEHPAILAHLAKYRSLIPSLALLIHLADDQGQAVGLDAVERACGWADYLESHARRVYGRGLSQDYIAAQALARKIHAREVTAIFTAREVYRHHWAHLATPDEVSGAVAVLVDYQWVRATKQSTGGRPSDTHAVNPRVWESRS